MDILKEGKDQWLELQENIKTALHKMRIDYDIPKIKELSLITDNRILKKRLNDKIKTNANKQSLMLFLYKRVPTMALCLHILKLKTDTQL